jgi:hypothetical protein
MTKFAEDNDKNMKRVGLLLVGFVTQYNRSHLAEHREALQAIARALKVRMSSR